MARTRGRSLTSSPSDPGTAASPEAKASAPASHTAFRGTAWVARPLSAAAPARRQSDLLTPAVLRLWRRLPILGRGDPLLGARGLLPEVVNVSLLAHIGLR